MRLERMTRTARAALLDDALGLWTIYGPKFPGLVRGPDAGMASLADLAITMPGRAPNGDGSGTVTGVAGLAHPASGGSPPEGGAPSCTVARRWCLDRCGTSPRLGEARRFAPAKRLRLRAFACGMSPALRTSSHGSAAGRGR